MSTATATATAFGDRLRNGSTLIERRETRGGTFVLAYTSGIQPWATWQEYEGNTGTGHYFDTLREALADFDERCGQGTPRAEETLRAV